MWKIPLFDVTVGDDEKKAVSRVLDFGWFSTGELTAEFESRFADYVGCKYAIAVSSGTAALHLAHVALGIQKADEVICPSLTFIAGINSILYTGATPVLADSSSLQDFSISPDDILRKISTATKAIQVMHFGGYPCDMEQIVAIAKKHQLQLIEDCAHAPGALLTDRYCGGFGDVSCFSFFPNKNMTTGEGGMIVTNNESHAATIRRMRSHGMTSLSLDRLKGRGFSYDVLEVGYNYRIDEIRSAMGIVQLGKLDGFNQKRRELDQIYREELRSIEEISIPYADPRVT